MLFFRPNNTKLYTTLNLEGFLYSIHNILIILFFTATPSFSQSGWVDQFSGTQENLYSVKFINSNTGWCVGDRGLIFKTTNSGTNWLSQESGSVNNLRSVFFSSSNTGYIVGDSGLVLKTINGTDWYRMINSIEALLLTVFFLDESNGFTGGYTDGLGFLFKTSNGGITWETTSLPFNSDLLTSIYFNNFSKGWITCGSSVAYDPKLFNTTNGGVNWEYVPSFSGVGIQSVFFVDSLFGWVASPKEFPFQVNPTIFRTTNGGKDWVQASQRTGSVSLSVFFINRSLGWAAGLFGLVYNTIDGGDTWLAQTAHISTKTYRSVNFTNYLTGWVVGDNGIILKTTTGGVLTGFSNTSAEIPDKYFLSQNYPNPFNPNTIINFQCSMFNFISLRVFDVLGNEVETLVNENKPAGKYQIKFDGSNYPSGVYFYRLEIDGNIIDTKRMVLLK